MADFARLTIQVDVKGAQQAKNALSGINTSSSQASRAAGALKAAFAGLLTTATIRQVINFTDAWTNASNRLRIVTDTTKEFKTAQSDLMQVANQTRSSFGATAELYSKLAKSTEEMGLGHERLVGLTETINMAMSASGASAAEAEGAIRQLGQALASGALRGDEFNSVAEQAPAIMRAIAAETNLSIGELRDFAAQGKITAEIVVNALENASDEIGRDFAESVATFGQKLTVATNNLQEFFGGVESGTGLIGLLGDGVVLLSENMDVAAAAITGVATAMSMRLFPAIAGLSGPVGIAVAGFATLISWLNDLKGASEEATRTLHNDLAADGLDAVDNAIAALQTRMDAAKDQGFFDSVKGTFGFGDDYRVLKKELEELIDLRAEVWTDMQPQQASHVDRYYEAIAEGAAEARPGVQALSAETIRLNNAIKAFDAEEAFRLNYEAAAAAAEDYHFEQERILEQQLKIKEAMSMDRDPLGFSALGGSAVMLQDVADTVEETGAVMMGVSKANKEEWAYFNDELEETEEVLTEAQKAAERMKENIQRAFGDELYNLLDEGKFRFENFFDSILNMMKRFLAEAVAADIMNAIFGGQGFGAFSNGETAALFQGLGNFLGITSGGSGGGSTGPTGNAIVNTGINAVTGSAITGGLSTAGAGIASMLGFGGPAAGGLGSPLTQAFMANFGGQVSTATAASATGGGLLGSIGSGISTAASSVGKFLSAIPGWGWALAGAGLLASVLDDSGTYSHNAGFLISPNGDKGNFPGVDPSKMFDVAPFASGLVPIGLNRRTTVNEANAVIDVFRAYDAALTEIFKSHGLTVDLSHAPFSAYDEKAKGVGAFYGSAWEDGSGAGIDINTQLTDFVSDWLTDAVLSNGFGWDVLNDILSQGDHEAMLKYIGGTVDGSHASGLSRVPFDGYIAELHQGERVLTADQAKQDDAVSSKLDMLNEMVVRLVDLTWQYRQTVDRWDTDGLPAERP